MFFLSKHFINRIIDSFYSLNFKFILLIAVFSFYTSFNLQDLRAVNCSVFEYALFAMSDHYYMMFFFLILYYVIIYGLIKDNSLFIIMRSKRYLNYFVSKAVAIIIFTFSIVFFQAVMALILGIIGLRIENTFTDTIVNVNSFAEIFITFHNAFHSPLAALTSVCLYLSLGLSALSILLLLLSSFLSEKALVIIQIINYLSMMVTLQLNIDMICPPLFLINYLLLHRAIHYRLPLLLSFISVLIMSVMLIIANRQRRNYLKKIGRIFLPLKIFSEVFTYKKLAVLLLISVAAALINLIKFQGSANTALEYAATVFNGYGLGYLNIIDFLYLLILNGMPIYFLSIYLGDKNSMRSIVMVRLKNKNKWLLHIQVSMLVFIIAQLLLIVLLTILVSGASTLLAGAGIPGNQAFYDDTNSLGQIIIGAFLRFLEIMFLQMLFLVIYSLVKNVLTAFMVSMSLYLSIIFSDFKFIPLGLSSISRIIELGPGGLLYNSLFPIVIFVSIYLVLYLYLIKSKAISTLISERSNL